MRMNKTQHEATCTIASNPDCTAKVCMYPLFLGDPLIIQSVGAFDVAVSYEGRMEKHAKPRLVPLPVSEEEKVWHAVDHAAP